ncbi:hypothetical protein [Flavobacterium reichenbachii]|uniref:Uncharacterized protein n=1 Tax=Flavobacterium reichenbachii TaxID=362418 RepID=A0A085ZPJ7_9FLAO|nr:hypothetical protein [Flavobacterium reichenbachii]KFF06361.1 hypothetical protein IW19_12915 [Flavobacterium reichenbachii]OXB17421.1 hypothetical protein B0A68_03760 [Flavobacterium reichenbachii]
MKTFEDLQNIWNQQTEYDSKPAAAAVIEKAEAHTKKIKRNHFWTRAILSLTVIILIFYYIWAGAYKQTQFSFGLCIMITMLIIRVALEWISGEKLENLKTDVTLLEYSKQANQFYQWRKKIHYIFTPIIYLTYTAGFTFLLPIFKETFSRGFYLYVVSSGFVFLLVFGLIMVRIIKKEMQLLDFLKSIS